MYSLLSVCSSSLYSLLCRHIIRGTEEFKVQEDEEFHEGGSGKMICAIISSVPIGIFNVPMLSFPGISCPYCPRLREWIHPIR